MDKEVLLKEASRNDLINELFTRESITSIQINEGDAAKITTKYGNVSVNGESNIFIINPNKSIRSTFNHTDKIHIAQNVTFDDKENITTTNSDVNTPKRIIQKKVTIEIVNMDVLRNLLIQYNEDFEKGVDPYKLMLLLDEIKDISSKLKLVIQF